MKFHRHQSKVCNVIIGYDDTSPEEWAALGAMFSRSVDGVEALAEKITADKAGKFMEQFYVGYGHASIGDMADIKVFIEGVPFYVACMLEHFSRFRGQESSTRYINFAKQKPAYDADEGVYREQIDTYLAAVRRVTNNLEMRHSDGNGAIGGTAARAIKARAFDICRSLLPWGATTNVAWYGDIRTITQHLAFLISPENPNRDITNIKPYVEEIFKAIYEVYPKSTKLLDDIRPVPPYPYPELGKDAYYFGSNEYKLDFGSWRDLNRHRVGCQIVLFDAVNATMHPWYDEMLTAHEIEWGHTTHPTPSINERLLGYTIPYQYTTHASQFAYLCQLRSKPSVHPTLRANVQKFANKHDFGADVTPDAGPFGFFEHRGNETILIGGKEL